MALKKTVTYCGLNVPDAYMRVETFRGLKCTDGTTNWTACGVDISVRAAAGADVLYTTTYIVANYDVAGANIYKQIYASLKTLPDFAGALDVFETGQTA